MVDQKFGKIPSDIRGSIAGWEGILQEAKYFTRFGCHVCYTYFNGMGWVSKMYIDVSAGPKIPPYSSVDSTGVVLTAIDMSLFEPSEFIATVELVYEIKDLFRGSWFLSSKLIASVSSRACVMCVCHVCVFHKFKMVEMNA